MNLEQLKAAMEAAAAKAAENPEDEALKAAAEEAKEAYEAAKAEEEGDDDKGDKGDLDDSKLDAATKAYIEKLRKEAAKRRIEAKDTRSKLKAEEERRKAILKAAGIEVEDENPTEQLKKSKAETNNLAFRAAILESAVENGIGKDSLKYYQFLMSEALGELEEGEELSEEKIAEIVEEAGTRGTKGKANSSVGSGKKDGSGKGTTPPQKPGSSGDISLDKFCRMTITEKSDLYTKNRELYESLVKEARAKKRLV